MSSDIHGENRNIIRDARSVQGWTQRYLAEKIGVEAQTIRSWERGRRFPSPEFRVRLSQVLDIPLEELERFASPQTRNKVPDEDQEIEQPSILVQQPETEHLDQQSDRAVQMDEQHTIAPAAQHRIPYITLPWRADKNRQRLLHRVRFNWITGVLDKLPADARLYISLGQRPDAVANVWGTAPVTESVSLPENTSIVQLYDESQEMLILGEPGAGKSTLLFELTRELIRRAKLDEASPIPVIFNLSSWGQSQQQLVTWLVSELNTKYQIPEKLAHDWVTHDQILPLLDGLDEVSEKARTACIEAINFYRKEHGLVPLIVCSRTSDYFSQSARLVLSSAVVLQPLSSEQVDEYISRDGESLTTMRAALQSDPSLRDMVSNPFMLNVITQAYRGKSVEEVLAISNLEDRRRMVFEHYIQRVLQNGDARYSMHQTMRWITWLATQLHEHNQTEFYIERIQPDWLKSRLRNRYRINVMQIVLGINILVISGLYACFRSDSVPHQPGLFYWLGGKGLGNTILGWMIPGLGQALRGGTSLGLTVFIVDVIILLIVFRRRLPSISLATLRHGFFDALRYGLIAFGFLGLFAGIVYDISGGVANGIYHGLGYGLLEGLLTGSIVLLRSQHDPKPHRPKEARLRNITGRLMSFFIYIICGALGLISIYSLESHMISPMIVILGCVSGVGTGLILGLGNVADLLLPNLGQHIEPAETVSWSWPMVWKSLPSSIMRGLSLMLVIGIPIILILISISGISYGLAYGWRYGLVYGSIVGVVNGVAAILTGILNSGWSSNVIDDQHLLTKPNQGIHNSMRNALFAAGVFGVIGGVVSGITSGVSFWIAGVPGWFTLLLGFTLVYTVLFAFMFCMAYGGAAVIEHYVLRWYLYRADVITWKYVPFLDYAAERMLLRKVGGGYIFAHRLLLEYFVGLSRGSSSEKESSKK